MGGKGALGAEGLEAQNIWKRKWLGCWGRIPKRRGADSVAYADPNINRYSVLKTCKRIKEGQAFMLIGVNRVFLGC